MDNWDKAQKYGDKLKYKVTNIVNNYDSYKKNLGLFIDKYKVVRRLFIIGIIANCYFSIKVTLIFTYEIN
jgi:hypothetical protein